MKNAKSKVSAALASMALVAALGLAACGGDAQGSSGGGSDTSTATEQAQTTSDVAKDTTAAKYDLAKAWYGQNEDDVVYYFEGAQKKTGAFLVYHATDNVYERWVGKMEASAEDQVTITDDESGDPITLTIEAAEDDAIKVASDHGTEATLTSIALDEVDVVLDTIGNYASKPGEPAKTPTAEELGGEYVIKVHTQGVGSIAYDQGDEEPFFGDDAFTHANAGDKITLMAKPKDEEYKFVKWTKDGEDLSTDAEVEITVEGDAEYTAVFE